MSDEHYRLESDIAGLAHVVAVELVEELDSPYVLRVRAALSGDPFDPSAALEANVALEIARDGATTRRVTGLVLEAEEGGERDGDVVLTIGPALSLLALERSSRIFQERTVPQILEEVLGASLGAYGRSVELDLRETYEPREYCVQWQETTLDFARRLMAEEGIALSFDHAGAVEALVLRDRNASYPELVANDGARLIYTDLEDFESADVVPERVDRFEPAARLGRTKLVVRDHDWTGPTQPEADAGGADDRGRERESYEHAHGLTLSIGSYDEGVRRYQAQDAARQAPLRLEADRARLRTFEGRSTIPALSPGVVVEMSGHPLGHDGRYLVTRVTHGEGARSGRLLTTRNVFTCIPIDVPHRPARVADKPRITGAEVARVTGPAGQEIHTDAHGRIKIQLPWDREGSGDERSSCWVRVSQRWAGNGFGTLHVPRVGMEVVVRYVHGDPDRPIVTGALYHGENLPPYPLPDEKTKSTIKSNSSLGGGGFNELRFEDAAGKEQIYLHAQKDLDEVVLANHTTTVGADQTNTVHHDQTQTVHQSQTETVHGNQELKALSDRTVVVLSGFEEDVDGTETRKVKSGVTEVIVGGQKRVVTGAVKETVFGGETRVVAAGGLLESLQAAHLRGILGDVTRIATGTFEHTATGAVTLETPASITVLAAGNLTVTGGPTVLIEAPTVFSFSNDHHYGPGSHTKAATTKKSVFNFVFGFAPLKMGWATTSGSLGVLKASLYKQALDMAAVSVGVTVFGWEDCADKVTIAGIVLNLRSFEAKQV